MAAISITAANVLKGSGANIEIKTLNQTATQGQTLYLAADGRVGLADANDTSPVNSFYGFALTSGLAGQPVVVNRADAAYTTGGTLVIGPVYLSVTPGAITQTLADLVTGSTLIIIGAATTTTSNGSILNMIAPITGGTT